MNTEIDGDTFFPAIDETIWEKVFEKNCAADEKNKFDMRFERWERKEVEGWRLKVQNWRFKVEGSKLKVQSWRFKVEDSKLKVQSSGLFQIAITL